MVFIAKGRPTSLAEAVRFELTDGCPSAVFKTAGLNHSPKSPEWQPRILAFPTALARRVGVVFSVACLTTPRRRLYSGSFGRRPFGALSMHNDTIDDSLHRLQAIVTRETGAVLGAAARLLRGQAGGDDVERGRAHAGADDDAGRLAVLGLARLAAHARAGPGEHLLQGDLPVAVDVEFGGRNFLLVGKVCNNLICISCTFFHF